jgi:hypothetical protein
MSAHTYPCSTLECDNGPVLTDSVAFVPVWCAECYLAYLIECENDVSRLADPIIFNKVLYALDLRDVAEGIGPEVVVRYFDGRAIRTSRLRVVMHMPSYTPDTALIAHGAS